MKRERPEPNLELDEIEKKSNIFSSESSEDLYGCPSILFLPYEIMVEIFHNLPVPDLRTCRSVCYDWKEISEDNSLAWFERKLWFDCLGRCLEILL